MARITGLLASVLLASYKSVIAVPSTSAGNVVASPPSFGAQAFVEPDYWYNFEEGIGRCPISSKDPNMVMILTQTSLKKMIRDSVDAGTSKSLPADDHCAGSTYDKTQLYKFSIITLYQEQVLRIDYLRGHVGRGVTQRSVAVLCGVWATTTNTEPEHKCTWQKQKISARSLDSNVAATTPLFSVQAFTEPEYWVNFPEPQAKWSCSISATEPSLVVLVKRGVFMDSIRAAEKAGIPKILAKDDKCDNSKYDKTQLTKLTITTAYQGQLLRIDYLRGHIGQGVTQRSAAVFCGAWVNTAGTENVHKCGLSKPESKVSARSLGSNVEATSFGAQAFVDPEYWAGFPDSIWKCPTEAAKKDPSKVVMVTRGMLTSMIRDTADDATLLPGDDTCNDSKFDTSRLFKFTFATTWQEQPLRVDFLRGHIGAGITEHSAVVLCGAWASSSGTDAAHKCAPSSPKVRARALHTRGYTFVEPAKWLGFPDRAETCALSPNAHDPSQIVLLEDGDLERIVRRGADKAIWLSGDSDCNGEKFDPTKLYKFSIRTTFNSLPVRVDFLDGVAGNGVAQVHVIALCGAWAGDKVDDSKKCKGVAV